MIFLAFLLAAILFVLSAALAGVERLHVFGDLPSFLFLLLGLVGYIGIYGHKHIRLGVKTFFAFSFPPDESSVEAGQFFQQLTKFTMRWGLFGMILGLIMALANLDLDTIGYAIAICLLTILYALGLALFVFMPIALRLLPPELPSAISRKWLAIRLLLTGLAIFFLMRLLIVVVVFIVADAKPDTPRIGPIFPGEFVTAVQRAAFTFNPADPSGVSMPQFADVVQRFESVPLVGKMGLYLLGWSPIFWNLTSLVLVVGSWWIFRLASGKRRKLLAAPVIILIGLFWSIQCFVFMLADLDPDRVAVDFLVTMLSTLYAFIAAAGFLLADIIRGFKDPPPLPPAEGAEHAKEIIDRAVEAQRR
jgi:hypothetical protein